MPDRAAPPDRAGASRRGTPTDPRTLAVIARIAAYARSFTGFERDARIFLLTTLVAGAAISLYWIDFNLYLSALGLGNDVIGLIAAGASLASALATFPSSGLSDRVGRRAVLAGGVVLMAAATGGLLLVREPLLLGLLAAGYAVGQQAFFVVQPPFLTEHSRPEHRNELFSLQFAISQLTNVLALVVGGVLATAIASLMGLGAEGLGAYRAILVFMAAAFVVSLATIALLSDDRPRSRTKLTPQEVGEPAPFPRAPRDWRAGRFGITIRDRRRFVRLVLPGFLIALGAGQLIPFLNLFIQRKFGLDLGQLNVIFAIASIGTFVAIMAQPALARRLGKVGSVVAVQAISIPFIVVLGFSPVLWTVVIAMAVRNSLMNAGNPIQNAFAMEQVHPSERATVAAAMGLLWSGAWVVAGFYYSFLQARLGFEAGYTVDFLTTIVLYSIGTWLYWHWWHGVEARERAEGSATPEVEAA